MPNTAGWWTRLVGALALGTTAIAATGLLLSAGPEGGPEAAQVLLLANDSTAGLDPALARAYLAAQADAAQAGVPLSLTSGARSHSEQQALWQDGLRTYGSPEVARRWVLPPEESAHVRGQAIDVGPVQGAQWLEGNGSRYGLCRTYENEWWHFELATTPGGVCPPMVPDASWARPAPAVGGNGSLSDPNIAPLLPPWLVELLATVPGG